MKASTIQEKKAALLEEKPKLNQRELAEQIGVPEGSLVASGVGEGTVRLDRHPSRILPLLCDINDSLAVGRNRGVLMECRHAYAPPRFFESQAWMFGAKNSLRFQLGSWGESFFVPATDGRGASIQIFDHLGQAVHKCFFPTESITADLESARHPKQKADLSWEGGGDSGSGNLIPDESTQDIEHEHGHEHEQDRFSRMWNDLGDIYNLDRLESACRLTRLQVLRQAGEESAQRLEKDSLLSALRAAARTGLPLRTEIDSPGCRLTRTTTLPEPQTFGKWLNLLGEDFNLHIDESRVHQVWRVALSLRPHPVTALEIFDKGDRPLLRFFPVVDNEGKEPASWREFLLNLQPLSIEEE